jgi:hypothetical protein
MPPLHEQIIGAHVAYLAHDVHAIAEVAWFRHRPYGGAMTWGTVDLFAEVGYTLGDVTPFVRYERTAFESHDDPYFAEPARHTLLHDRFSAGVKYAASASVAFKVQGAVQKDDDDLDFIAIAQAAFAF